MVLAAKIFEVRESYPMDVLADKLKKFRFEREEKFNERSFTLVTEVKDLGATRNMLEGIFAYDTLFTVMHHGQMEPYVRTFEAPFTFDNYKGRTFLTIYEKKTGQTTLQTR